MLLSLTILDEVSIGQWLKRKKMQAKKQACTFFTIERLVDEVGKYWFMVVVVGGDLQNKVKVKLVTYGN